MDNRDKLQYIQAIRNPAKRGYAIKYLAWLRQGEPEGLEPERGELSYMAAQAVRMNLQAV